MSTETRTGSFDNKIYFGAIFHNGKSTQMAVQVVEDARNDMKHLTVDLPDGMTDYHQITEHVRAELRTQLSNPKLSWW